MVLGSALGAVSLDDGGYGTRELLVGNAASSTGRRNTRVKAFGLNASALEEASGLSVRVATA